MRGASVVRGPKREFISRAYNVLLRTTLSARFSDAQCGFKAVRADTAAMLLPLIEDTGWFFDTEMLVLAERAGCRIHEVPVDWVDDIDSRVHVWSTAVGDLKGVVRLARGLATGRIPIGRLREQLALAAKGPAASPPSLAAEALRFAVVGVVCTVAYLALFLVGRAVLPAIAANGLALFVTAVGNTTANRRYTFGLRGRRGSGRHQLQGFVVFLAALFATSSALAGFNALGTHSALAELAVLVGVNLLVTVGRFMALRAWVFRRRVESASDEAMEDDALAAPGRA